MRAALGRDPGLRVALLDYFTNVATRPAQPEDHRDRDVRADGALRGERRAHRPLQPRLPPAGTAPGGAALEASRPAGGARPPRPRRLQARQRRARSRRGRPGAHEGRGHRARQRPRDRRGRPLRGGGVRGAPPGHVPAGGVRRRGADQAEDRGAVRPRADAGHDLGRDRRVPRRRRSAGRPDRAGGRGALRGEGRGEEPHPAPPGREAPLPAAAFTAARHRGDGGERARRPGSRTSPRAACS